MNSVQNITEVEGGTASQIIAKAYGFVTWFMELPWYISVFIVIVGSFLFFRIECALEDRKQKREAKKEGLGASNENVNKLRGILRKADRKDWIEKHVSFNQSSTSSVITRIFYPLVKIYDLWIVPWTYVLFRSIGFR